jgi:cbb3-type cytochrome oxidase maturation protein
MIMGGEVVFYEFLISLFMGIGALSILIWSILSGHFEEMEDAKYRMLEREREDGKQGT